MTRARRAAAKRNPRFTTKRRSIRAREDRIDDRAGRKAVEEMRRRGQPPKSYDEVRRQAGLS